MDTFKVHQAPPPDTSNNRKHINNDELIDEVFARLLKDLGLKPDHNETSVRNCLEKVLGYDDKALANPHLGQIQVDVQLAREKDQKLPHRVTLAEQVQDTLEESLQSQIQSDGSLELLVRIFLVSDGTSVASRRFTSGVGTAKVTVAYCVVQRGNSLDRSVLLANTIYQTAPCQDLDLDTYWEASSAVVRSLARQASQHIVAQITYQVLQWKKHCQEKNQK